MESFENILPFARLSTLSNKVKQGQDSLCKTLRSNTEQMSSPLRDCDAETLLLYVVLWVVAL